MQHIIIFIMTWVIIAFIVIIIGYTLFRVVLRARKDFRKSQKEIKEDEK